MADIIRIKPHHFVDIVSAFGRGQRAFAPHPYGHAVHAVAERLLRQPDVLLEIELGADTICQPCVHNIEGRCDDTIDTACRPTAPESKGEFNLLIDQRWCERLGLQQGDSLPARELCRRLRPCVDGLASIYRENQAAHTAARAQALQAGIEAFLAMPAATRDGD